jgi:hypothetical protein
VQKDNSDFTEDLQGARGVHFTLLPNRFALSRRFLHYCSIDKFANACLATKADSKADLPWVKLAKLGPTPSEHGSYRYDANVVELSGAEGDYDGTDISIEDTADLLIAADIECVLSETATPGHWRVWLPASKSYSGTPDELRTVRAQWVARVNGVLGGILARESFVLSQAFYIGGITGQPAPKVITIFEAPRIDLCDHLDAGALYPNGRSEPTPPPEWNDVPDDLAESDDDPELTEEGRRRVYAFLRAEAANAKSPTATGTRAWRICAWLADMRTWDKLILSPAGIANLLRNDFPDTDENAIRRMLTTRRKPRGCSEI